MFKYKIVDRGNSHQNRHPRETDHPRFLQGSHRALNNDQTNTILVTDLEEQHTMGSLALTRRELKSLDEDVRNLIPTKPLNRDYIWECSALCSPCFQEFSGYFLSSSHFFSHFFDTLYKGIVTFGSQNEVGFVGVKLTMDDYISTKEFGLWPYVIEFFPDEFSENIFYGILCVKGSLYENYKKSREELEMQNGDPYE